MPCFARFLTPISSIKDKKNINNDGEKLTILQYAYKHAADKDIFKKILKISEEGLPALLLKNNGEINAVIIEHIYRNYNMIKEKLLTDLDNLSIEDKGKLLIKCIELGQEPYLVLAQLILDNYKNVIEDVDLKTALKQIKKIKITNNSETAPQIRNTILTVVPNNNIEGGYRIKNRKRSQKRSKKQRKQQKQQKRKTRRHH